MSFFSAARFEELRIARKVTWGRPVRVHEICESTNDLALEAIASDAKTGIVFLAKEQTKGRGRRGRSWLAPPGQSLTFSMLLRFPPAKSQVTGLSLISGLALADVVKARLLSSQSAAPCHVAIKWPNDLYLNSKKVAGILIETRPSRDPALGVVLGIGLNVNSLSFPEELPDATSLALQKIDDLEFESLLVDILGALEQRMSSYLSHGLSGCLEELRQLDFLRERKFSVDGMPCIGQGIDETGHLLVQDQEGLTRSVSAGELTDLR